MKGEHELLHLNIRCPCLVSDNFHHTKNFLCKLLLLAPMYQDSVCLKGVLAKKGRSKRKEGMSFSEASSTSIAKAVVITVHLDCYHRW